MKEDAFIEISIKQKVLSLNRLFKLVNKYKFQTEKHPDWNYQDSLHIINFMKFLEKELKKEKK